ncbi:MAG: molybdopterin-dependent oxidoreductase [Christensenellales bacterium]
MVSSKGFSAVAVILALLMCLMACTAASSESAADPTVTAQAAPTPEATEDPPQVDEPAPVEEDDSGLTFLPGYTFPSLVGLTGEERDAAAAAKNAYTLETYAPTVKVLSNGVKVQPVPYDKYAFNTAIINAENRGCNACHDLMEVVQLLPMSHSELVMLRNVEATIGDCFGCHRPPRVPMGECMHGLHLNSNNFKGNCMSCHTIDPATGEYSMYDFTKYDIMYGITDVPNVQGEFSWTQETLSTVEDTPFWWNGIDERGLQPTYKGYDEDPDAFLNWEIKVTGDVENPGSFKLAEFAEANSVTRTITIMCTVNQPGGSLIANVEMTGIPLSYIAEQFGMKESVNDVHPKAEDWLGRSSAVDYYKPGVQEGLLVYKIDGQYLKPIHGYPCQIVLPGGGAGMWVKRPYEIEFRTNPTPTTMTKGDGFSHNGHTNKVNAAIFDHHNGEFFPYGEPLTFEGYAWAYNDPIIAVEFSLDRGKTWTRYETPEMFYQNWVHWTYTIKPETIGSYVLRVRGITEGGLITEVPGELMFNIE